MCNSVEDSVTEQYHSSNYLQMTNLCTYFLTHLLSHLVNFYGGRETVRSRYFGKGLVRWWTVFWSRKLYTRCTRVLNYMSIKRETLIDQLHRGVNQTHTKVLIGKQRCKQWPVDGTPYNNSGLYYITDVVPETETFWRKDPVRIFLHIWNLIIYA